MIVGQATLRCSELSLPIGDEVIAARLKLLADCDRIEGIDDLRRWRHSEVRLKDWRGRLVSLGAIARSRG